MTPVSIIIPTYNGQHLLQKHLPDVIASMRTGDELIIVDDASTDLTVSWLTREFDLKPATSMLSDVECYKGKAQGKMVQVLVNTKNQRFASSCNRGALMASSDILVLLNNDVSPEKDFLQTLVPHFADQLVFGVGCREKASSEGNKEYGKAEAHFERGFYVHNRAASQSTGGETAWVAGGSGAFRTSMWKKLGGFDLDFKPAYGEDIDLSYRAQMHGWKTLFEPSSIVYHVHESTNESVFGQHKIEIMSYKNALLFMWKNTKGKILFSHILWLPYHIVFTTIRSQGRFLIGLWRALKTQLRLNY